MSFVTRIDSALLEFSEKDCVADNEGTRTITYKQFNELSLKVAEKLKAVGINEGDSVIICMGRCHEYVAAEYGAMRMGAVAIPIIPSYPEARIEFIKNDSGAKLVISEDFFTDIDNYGVDIENIKVDYYGVDENEETEDKKRMIIYTSGSTGNPKGVIYRNKAISNALDRNVTEALLKIKPFVYGASATMSFTVTITEYYRCFAMGGLVHIISEDTRKDIVKVQDYYAEHNISMGFLSPRMLRVYKNKDKALKIIGTGSERVVNTFSEEYAITNSYGQTETVGGFCKFKIDKPYENTPVGKPMDSVSIKLIDDEGKEVPNGEEGFVVAIGNFPYEYNNLPEQTAKTFEKLENGLIAVHTGDRGKLLPDGNLLFVNRNDWMIKVHGQRVEPGEIEAVMNEAKGVTASVVKGFELEDGSMLLCGFYTGNADKEDVLKIVEGKLPHYMVPGILVQLDKFPVNPNGKVDRLALTKPDLATNQAEYVAPENELQEKICKAMEVVLSIGKIGINDDFYRLGGNSINAVLLGEESGIEGLSPQIIMRGKTPKGIAAQYEIYAENLKPELTKKYDVQSEYPLTLGQKYNFYDCESIGDTIDLMDLRAFYELDDTVEIEKLKKAIEDSLKAHKVYGINFNKENGTFIRNNNYDASVLEIDVEPDKFEEYRINKSTGKRDILNDRMYDIEVIHVGEKTFLYMNLSHQIFDGASIGLLFNEISDRYEGKTPLAEEYDIFDVAMYEKEVKESSFYEKALEFFDSNFSNLEKKPEGDSMEHQDSAVRRLSTVDFDKIGKDDFLREAGISEITYIQGALSIALSKILEKEKLTYKVIHSGRDTGAYSTVHGSIARAVYVAADVNKDMTVKEYLNNLQDVYQDSVYYDVVPMCEMAEKYPEVESEIYLNFRGKSSGGFHLGNKTFEFLQIGYFYIGKHIEALLNFQIDELPDGRLSLNLGAGFFSKEKTENILNTFEKALELIVTCEKIDDVLKGL